MIVALPFGRMRVFEGSVLEVGERDRIKPRLAELQAASTRSRRAPTGLPGHSTTPAADAAGVLVLSAMPT